MRILITTDWYEPVINGVVTSVLTLKRELVKRGHEVRVATLSDCGHSYKKMTFIICVLWISAGFIPAPEPFAFRAAAFMRS